MITPGATFIIYNPDRGTNPFYILLSIIEENTRIFAVRIVPKKDNSDTSCILREGDHKFIIFDSVIDYERPITPKIDILKKLLDSGSENLKPHEPVSEDVFNRICRGALNSEVLYSKYLKYIPKIS